MTRCFYVSLVLVPLLFGLTCLIFSLTTESWTKLDTKFDFKRLKEDRSLLAPQHAQHKLKKVRLELLQYSSLFGECDNHMWVDLWMPMVDHELELLYNLTQLSPLPAPSTSTAFGLQAPVAESARQAAAAVTAFECISVDMCRHLNKMLNGSCFCCSDQCCLLKTNLCDGVSNCKDGSDENNNCPKRRLHFASRYHDTKHNCWKHQYNLWDFTKGFFERYFMGKKVNTSQYSLSELMKQSQSHQSVRIFIYRVLTIFLALVCVLCTLMCFVTLLFVTCCHDLAEAGGKRRKPRASGGEDDSTNGFTDAPHDYDQYSVSASADSTRRRAGCRCCKCHCLLCPFVAFAVFAAKAAVACLLALAAYLASLYHVKANYLIYDTTYVPAYITKAYQYNSWLFDAQVCGLSFYALLASCFFYVSVLVIALTISCRIQMSPAWRRRYADSYEVLEMNNLGGGTGGGASGAASSKKTKASKNSYKKLEQKDVDASDKNGKSNVNKKTPEMAKAVPESDEISLYDEAQTLTSPKTRVENSYE